MTCVVGPLANGVECSLTITVVVAAATGPGTISNTANGHLRRGRPEPREQHRGPRRRASIAPPTSRSRRPTARSRAGRRRARVHPRRHARRAVASERAASRRRLAHRTVRRCDDRMCRGLRHRDVHRVIAGRHDDELRRPRQRRRVGTARHDDLQLGDRDERRSASGPLANSAERDHTITAARTSASRGPRAGIAEPTSRRR